MHNEPCCRLALAESQRQRLVHEFRTPLIGHRPSHHSPRTQIEPHSERQPTFACRKRGHIAHIDLIWCMHRQLSIELVRGHRLGLACRRRRFACAPRFAAQTRLGEDAPNAPAAHLETCLRHQILAAARAIRATALDKRVPDFVLEPLLRFGLYTGWPAEPLITLLCGRNCQVLLCAFSSLLLSITPFLVAIGRSYTQAGSVGEWAPARFTRPLAVSASCVLPPRLSAGALHVWCVAGFVTRRAVSPQTTFYPCWRRGRQAPHPVCALWRLEKHRGERPPLQHGSAREPGSTSSRSHQPTHQAARTRTHAARLSCMGHQRGLSTAALLDSALFSGQLLLAERLS
jgi:hypothetical protein